MKEFKSIEEIKSARKKRKKLASLHKILSSSEKLLKQQNKTPFELLGKFSQ